MALGLLLPFLILAFLAPVAYGQYVFLDANGDGVNDRADQLPATGSADIDIWFVTDRNRDGSPATCTTDQSEALTINSFEIVLRALNGRVAFGPMRNRLAYTGNPVSFAGYEDTTSTTVYHNGWGYRDILPPGRYLVATLTIEVVEGLPSLAFAGHSPVQPSDLTSFGTGCSGTDWDNTYVLGEEFFDAAGIGRPLAAAGGPYHGVVNTDVRFDGTGSSDPDGDLIDYAWSFDDGGSAAGAVVSHAFATIGGHAATLAVSSPSGSDDDVAEVNVGPFEATFVRSNSFDLTVTPNPFNPTAHIILHTRTGGPMSALLFDIRGRRVKSILRGEPMPAGRHDLIVEARDDGGAQLASGVYFLQVTSRDGTRTGRVVVAK